MLLVFGRGNLVVTLLLMTLVLVSVALHELGHTVVSQRYDINVHDIVLTPIGGVARLGGLPDNPHHEIRIALAGPYVSLLLAVTGFALYILFGSLGLVYPAIAAAYLAGLNTALVLFNMLPSFPMDGGRVLRGWLTQRKGALEATRIASGIGKGLSILFFVIGAGSGSWSLAIIGIFIFMAAGSEYRMMRLKAWQDQQFGAGGPETIPEADFEASPPPYEKPKRVRLRDGLVGDMITAARDLLEETCRSCFNR